ncbi:MAG: restriction endonuclease, partial [Flavipsychrobacter sp.]
MNTVSRGNAFEKRVVEHIKELLQKNLLPINCERSTVFEKKGYYSQSRKSNIVVDISVECTLPDDTEPSLYLMIECKDYSNPVPVDDLEEFVAKLDQITGLNCKAIFVTSNILQEGALNYAISNNIRVMKIDEHNKREILSFRREKSFSNDTNKEYINAILSLTSAISASIHYHKIGIGPAMVYK